MNSRLSLKKQRSGLRLLEFNFLTKYLVSQDTEKYLQGISTVPSQQEKTITLRIWRSSTKKGCTTPFWIPLLKRCSDDSKERIIVQLALSSNAYTVFEVCVMKRGFLNFCN